MISELRLKNNWIFTLLWIIPIIYISYFLPRENFLSLTISYSIAFGGFLWLTLRSNLSTNNLLFLGIALRSILFFAEPELSNDYYRFIWDGRMSLLGLNPYLSLPEVWVNTNPEIINNAPELYKGMGALNGSHYTCYPPINQLYFILSSLFHDSTSYGSALWMRFFIFISEIGMTLVGIRILKKINLNPNRIHLIWLNPFFILETHVNLHFEGVMIFYLALAFWYILKKNIWLGGIFFALSIAVKAIPLIFLPVFLKFFGFKKFIQFGLITGLSLIVLFTPFLSTELYHNFMNSIELYFTNFEFNASIYYIIREIGYHVKGYNIIQSVGKITPFVLIAFTVIISLLRKNKQFNDLILSLLLVISFYYFTATTVHPWYIILVVFISIFQKKFHFPILWSFLLIFSYYAYSNDNFKENMFLLTVEYVLLYGLFFRELFYFLKKDSKTTA
jgi:hypothetical protein